MQSLRLARAITDIHFFFLNGFKRFALMNSLLMQAMYSLSSLLVLKSKLCYLLLGYKVVFR